MASGYINLPLVGSSSSGVSSLNALTGALTLIAGSNITITPSGSNITIASTGSTSLIFDAPLVNTAGTIDVNGVVADNKLAFVSSGDSSKELNFSLSGQAVSTTLTIAPLNTSSMVLNIPQVATAAGAGMALVQDETTGFIFSYGVSSSIGAANSMMQLANASTANRAQIKLHSYFNGTSVAGVSTLTSRSGTIAVNSSISAGQDYSKWTAQAAAATAGSAPISGTFAFKANSINSLTVPSDFHLQLTNLAGTLADRLYLTSEGLLQLPGYGAGNAVFDSSGHITSVASTSITALTGDVTASGPGSVPATLSQAVHKRYVDFISGNDLNTGSLVSPWKTLQHAYDNITPTINEPYTLYISGGNNDTDTAIIAKPNVSIVSDYLIQITPSFTISGGATNDGCSFTNIIFVGAFNWVRNDATEIGLTFNNCQFFSGPVLKQTGAGTATVLALNSTFVNSEFQVPNGFAVFSSCSFLGTTTFDDPGSSGLAYYQFDGGYSDGAMSISGLVSPVYFTGFVHDVAFGASLTFVTTGSGTPTVEADSNGLPPTYTGSPTITRLSNAKYEAYSPSTPSDWVLPAPTTVQEALDRIAAVVSASGATPIP